jgi:DNA-binding NtrC family response regulator
LYAVGSGVFEYIIKPADRDELIDLVTEAAESTESMNNE